VDAADSIFDQHCSFDPAEDFETFVKRVPAKGAVYLLTDAQSQPVQLLCVRNLRYSLKRRLGSAQEIVPSRRIDYRQIVRGISFRRVDSVFEADWLYYEAARQIFPKNYRAMLGFRPAWFVQLDSHASFPRYTRTSDINAVDVLLLGPMEDKQDANAFIELMEDAFDLCRYYNILVDAPRGKACPYKEMGRCPAPCDGSISMAQYRFLIDWSAQIALDPEPCIAQHQERMRQAALALDFETAAKVKEYIEQLHKLTRGPFRYVRPLADFRYLCLQRGPRPGTAKLFLITPGAIQEIAGLIAEPCQASDVPGFALALAAGPAPALDYFAAERIGIVTRHLFQSRQSGGVFFRLDQVSEASLVKAFGDLRREKVADPAEEEGLVKELQAMKDKASGP